MPRTTKKTAAAPVKKPTVAETRERIESLVTEMEELPASRAADLDDIHGRAVELIGTLNPRSRKSLTERVGSAYAVARDRVAAGREIVLPSSVDTAEYPPSVLPLIEKAVTEVRDGIHQGRKLSGIVENIANTLLSIRLNIDYNGLPDITGLRQSSRDAGKAVWTAVAIGMSDADKREIEAIKQRVWGNAADILIKHIRALNDAPEEYRREFPMIAARFPKMRPEDAIRKAYAEIGTEIGTKTRAEVGQEKRANKALDASTGAIARTKKGVEDLVSSARRYTPDETQRVMDEVDDMVAKLAKLRLDLRAKLQRGE